MSSSNDRVCMSMFVSMDASFIFYKREKGSKKSLSRLLPAGCSRIYFLEIIFSEIFRNRLFPIIITFLCVLILVAASLVVDLHRPIGSFADWKVQNVGTVPIPVQSILRVKQKNNKQVYYYYSDYSPFWLELACWVQSSSSSSKFSTFTKLIVTTSFYHVSTGCTDTDGPTNV